MNVGYSLYKKGGEIDEYVPYLENGSSNDVSTFLSTYTKYDDFDGSTSYYNGAPSLIDFDPSVLGGDSLEYFRKDNTTIFIDDGSMLYYDENNKYRWRNDELLDPRIYSDDYKNVGYKGFVFNDSSVSTNIVKYITTVNTFNKDLKGNNEWAIIQEYGLSDLVVKSGSTPVFDGNNYLIWI